MAFHRSTSIAWELANLADLRELELRLDGSESGEAASLPDGAMRQMPTGIPKLPAAHLQKSIGPAAHSHSSRTWRSPSLRFTIRHKNIRPVDCPVSCRANQLSVSTRHICRTTNSTGEDPEDQAGERPTTIGRCAGVDPGISAHSNQENVPEDTEPSARPGEGPCTQRRYSAAMSTQRYLVADLLRKGSGNQESRARWDFWTHFSIPADIHSVFYALTEPEYIEAWLLAPGFQSARVMRAGADYSIQFRNDEAPSIEIRGSWLSRYPGQIALTWNRNDEAMRVESTVSVEIRQAPGRTLLHLYHYGFDGCPQSLWHGELWNSSVLRLARLTAAAGDGSPAHVCAVSPLHRRQLVDHSLRIRTKRSPNVCD